MTDPTPEELVSSLDGLPFAEVDRVVIEWLVERDKRLAEREGTIVRLVKDADAMRALQQKDHTEMSKLRARISELEAAARMAWHAEDEAVAEAILVRAGVLD